MFRARQTYFPAVDPYCGQSGLRDTLGSVKVSLPVWVPAAGYARYIGMTAFRVSDRGVAEWGWGRMSESQTYSPTQLLAIGQRAEAEGKFDYATQFYSHLAEHYRNTAEAHEALYGLQRIERYLQAQAAQARNPQPQPSRRDASQTFPQQQRQPSSQTGGRGATRTAQSGPRHEWPQTAQQERANLANTTVARSSLPAPVRDDEEEEDTRLPRLVARAGMPDDDEYAHGVPEYRIGRFMSVVLAAIGWILLVVGLVVLLAGLAGVPASFSAAGLVGLPLGVELGLGAIAAGVMLLFVSQLGRAVFDTAGAARELVEIERAKSGL